MNPRQSFINTLTSKLKNSLSSTTTYTRPKDDNTVLVQNIARSIANNETGGVQGNRYAFAKQSGNPSLGRDLGEYQVTDGELKTYAPRFLGQSMTGDQFLASSTAQDKYMQGKAQYYLNKGYTPQQIADIHRRGIKNSGTPGSATYQDPTYVQKFNNTFLSQK